MENNNVVQSEEIKEVQPAKPELDEAEKKRLRKKKWLNIWDHITTGLLILLMASPILILTYIFLWFIL